MAQDENGELYIIKILLQVVLAEFECSVTVQLMPVGLKPRCTSRRRLHNKIIPARIIELRSSAYRFLPVREFV